MANLLESLGRADIGGRAIRLKESLERSRSTELSQGVTGINLQKAKNELATQEAETTRRSTSANLLTNPMFMSLSPGGQERIKADMLSKGVIDTEGIGTVGGGEDYASGMVNSIAGFEAMMKPEVEHKKNQFLQADKAVRDMEAEAAEKGKDLKTDKKYGIAVQSRDNLKAAYDQSQAGFGAHSLKLKQIEETGKQARLTAVEKAENTLKATGTTYTKLEGSAFRAWLAGEKLTSRQQSIVDLRMDNDNALFAVATKLVMDDPRLSFKGVEVRSTAIRDLFEQMKTTRDAGKTPDTSDFPTLEEFLPDAREANPGVSDAELTTFYNQWTSK